MKNLLLCLSVLFLFCCSKTKKQQSKTEKGTPKPPNIVYILADDLGYGDVSANNPQSKIQTTFIDQLATEGMRFTDAHSPSSVCTPTRYGILTGRYCWRSRLPQGVLRGFGRALIEKDRKTVASLLQNNGYTTGVVGKWHLGLDWVIKEGQEITTAEGTQMNEVGMVQDMDQDQIDLSQQPTDGPLNHGFNYSFILPASLDMPPYCYLENDKLVTSPSEHTPGNDLNTGYTEAFWRAGGIAPDFEMDEVLPTFKNKAIQFIEKSAEADKPFFLYLPFAAPHTPWVPTADFKNSAKAGTYGDFVKMVDAAVGEVLKTIDKIGAKDNTLVIFTSDNGPFWTPTLIEKYKHKSVAELRGMKADAWDGGHRIPFIVRWPNHVPAGSTSPAITTLTNLFATVADILKVPISTNEGEDSHSILPILLGKTNKVPNQEAIVHHSSKGYFAIRKGNWKLIEGRGSGGFSEPRTYQPKAGEPTGQLYNLKKDIGERDNLFLTHPDKVAELLGLLEEIRGNGSRQ